MPAAANGVMLVALRIATGNAMNSIRGMIESQVLGLTGMALKEIDFENPKGEPGLFGPKSAIWQVHGDFTSMLCGGISALLLQMLHPLALAGVWDHSRFREDIFGRLRRTSQFISATTFGTTDDAERLIAKVQGIHQRISGVAPDGTPYRASDPALLTWVHVAECSSFMASHLRYKRTIVTAAKRRRSPGDLAPKTSPKRHVRWRSICRICAPSYVVMNERGRWRRCCLPPVCRAG